jgi:hypothetical protein
MSRLILAADLAEALLPHWCRHRTFAVLRAYFDESGIHAGSRTTILSGFIGSRKQWRLAARKWQGAMKGRVFHYKEMRFEGLLLDKLATILDESGLEVVTGGFMGNWDRAINSGPADWPKRFPSCYQFILEMCVQRTEQFSRALWHNEPISLIFSRQDQYAKKAEEISRLYKGNGMWESVNGFGYGDPDLPELQAADMIAHETFQCTRQVYEGGASASPDVISKWPLLKKLTASKRLILGSHMPEQILIDTLTEQDKNRRYFKPIDKAN